MRPLTHYFKCIVASVALIVGVSVPLTAFSQDSAKLQTLYAQLQEADINSFSQIEREIYTEWGKTGSAAMDLLVKRGRDALDDGQIDAALDHFSALVDHAPDLAEGYAGRATAYYRLDMYGPALDDLRQVLVLDPQHFTAITGMSVILEELGEVDAALAGYREVLRLHPNQPEMPAGVARIEAMVDGQTI
jgi:tetratricopeptide (TPR) repeat protein